VYEYSAAVLSIHDADTCKLRVDLGFGVFKVDTFRLHGINAPELNTAEGKAARDWLRETLAAYGNVVTVRTFKDKQEKFGRFLAELWVDHPRGDQVLVNVNALLVEKGHAVFKQY
jgi:micrococcal nuclease